MRDINKYHQFRVNDDEMDSGYGFSLCDGDFILARKIDEKYWSQRLNINSWLFVLVFKNEDYIIRKIIEHNIETMSVLCHPLNLAYSDSIVYLDDLYELYNVIRIIGKNNC
ncbi:MAG: hypothetical protein FWF53_06740 [Candidatus Azobacteroides sp.]|nr:hypothetical protein [Candidatus Azobacteroides sp.]